jgi:hypothetical protein
MTVRRWLVTAITAFVVLVAVFSCLPYHWTGTLNTPKGQNAQTVSVRCGALWESGSVQTKTTDFPVEGTPCGTRNRDQAMSFVDVGVGVIAVFVIGTWGRRRLARMDDTDGPVPDPA